MSQKYLVYMYVRTCVCVSVEVRECVCVRVNLLLCARDKETQRYRDTETHRNRDTDNGGGYESSGWQVFTVKSPWLPRNIEPKEWCLPFEYERHQVALVSSKQYPSRLCIKILFLQCAFRLTPYQQSIDQPTERTETTGHHKASTHFSWPVFVFIPKLFLRYSWLFRRTEGFFFQIRTFPQLFGCNQFGKILESVHIK